MKFFKPIKYVLVLQIIGSIFSVFCFACAGFPNGYIANRCRDGSDIFTAAVGVGGGAKIRLGPINIGVPVSYSENERGLKGGTIIKSDNGSGDIWIIIGGLDNFISPDKARDKSHVVATLGPEGPALIGSGAVYTQIEVLLGLGCTLRFGFNPGELLDFILGLATIDIYEDDIFGKNNIEQRH